MKVYKYFTDLHKEEIWLDEMAKQGFRFTSICFGVYCFDNTSDNNGICTYKIDYRTFHKESDFINYCTIFEDCGWLHIAGTKKSGSQYFVKIRPDTGDDIFSDNLSRAGRYKRISVMWLSLAISYSVILIMLLQQYGYHFYQIFDINRLYLTPGLWDLKGWRFVRAFLFETPFALGRGLGLFLMLFVTAAYAYYAIKAFLLYRKELTIKIN